MNAPILAGSMPNQTPTPGAISPEEPKRLQPTQDVARELFLKCGNLCAFPGCTALMMNQDGVFIGQLCHIEAAEKRGQRFNPAMTNEDRRAFSNLMLMCYPHHKITDDVSEYPVSRLRAMKQEHEAKFSDPARAMLAMLKDWTTHEQPTFAQTLKGMSEELGWDNKDEDLAGAVDELQAYIETFRNVPVASRKIMGLLVARKHRLSKNMKPARRRNFEMLIDDAKEAFQLSPPEFGRQLDILRHHGLLHVDRNFDNQEIFVFYGPSSGWPLWDDLAEFAEKRKIPMERFTVELRFDLLDA
jgi:DNA-binding transcriptional ArsR family regulator